MSQAVTAENTSFPMTTTSPMLGPPGFDPLDTQMLDYQGDIDIQMQGSESWFQTEATMEDEIRNSPIPSVTVEVDMDGDEDGAESAEYEMTDGDEQLQESAELVDVEVHDASHIHTPLLNQDLLPPSGLEESNVFSHSPVPESSGGHAIDARSHEDLSRPDFTDNSNDLSNDNQPSETESATANQTETPESRHVVTEFYPESSEAITSTFAELEPSFQEGQSVPEINEAHGSDAASHTNETIQETNERAPALPLDLEHQSALVPHTELSDMPNLPDDASNPLEISEGVYIDPPPPVLLSLPLDNEVCLFSHPTPRSGSASPVDGPSSHASLPVLLHNQPTLYYEPLISVFGALRSLELGNEIRVSGDSELILNAYDLHLPISEDNIYAREVTLHDLNALHDSSGLSGPLRLRLSLHSQRFIVRYNALRERVARLPIVPEDEKESHKVVSRIHEGIQGQDHQLESTYHELPEPRRVVDEQAETTGSYHEREENDEQHEAETEADLAVAEDENTIDEEFGAVDDGTLEGHDPPGEGEEAGLEYEAQSGTQKDALAENDDGVQHEGLSNEQDQEHLADQEQEETYSVDATKTLEEAESGEEAQAAVDSALTDDHLEEDFDEAGGDPNQTYDGGSPEEGVNDLVESSTNHVDAQLNGNSGGQHDSLTELTEQIDFANIEKEDEHQVIISGDPEDLPEDLYEDEWDDSPDGDGENEASSAQSSVTLASKTSSKRAFDSVDHDGEEVRKDLSPGSPGLKRLRVD